MALPPNIPTSFVPHSAQGPARRFSSGADFSGALGFIGYGALALVVVVSFGVFIYGRVLAATLAADDQALAKAQASIDPATVQSFVRLQDRLTSSKALLEGHLQMSSFFALLGTVLPTSVSISTLSIDLDATGKPKIEATGVAANFNALAAASNAIAADGRIKNAIFSHITINSDHTVGFALAATLDPALTAFSASGAPQAEASTSDAMPAEEGTASTSTP